MYRVSGFFIYIHTYIHTHYLTTPSRGLFRANGNKYKQNRNLLRIPAGGRLTSWLFTKRGGFEFGTTEDKSIQWQGAGFEVRITSPTPYHLGHACLRTYTRSYSYKILTCIINLILPCLPLSWLRSCVINLILSWVSNRVIGFHYPVSSKENCREAQSSITQYTTSIAMLPALLSWWCSGYHTRLVCRGMWVQIPFKAKFTLINMIIWGV